MKFFSLLLLFLLCAAPARGQQSIVDQFERRSHTREGFTLPYRLFVPDGYDAGTAYPLVLALHGAGERGSDNERQIALHRVATSWADPANQAKYPAFVVAPQVPSNLRWSAEQPVDASSITAVELTTLALLDSLEAEFNIDPDRVYITGLSMGGHGTWDLIARRPHRFAAAVPMSGRADPTQADEILHMPIWAFHGETDTVVPASGSRAIVQVMENLGRDVVYTDCRRAPVSSVNYDCSGPMPDSTLRRAIEARADLLLTSARGVGHGPWTVWYDHPRMIPWMFAQFRADPDAIVLTAPTAATASGEMEVAWTHAGEAADTVEVWLSRDDGTSWALQGTALLGDGRFAFDTSEGPDAAYAKVRLVVLNDRGFVYGRAASEPFVIDNPGDAPPEAALDDAPLRLSPTYTAQNVTLGVRAADPEGETLTARVSYSIDGGSTFAPVAEQELEPAPGYQPVAVPLAPLPNASEARLRVEVTDGAHTVTLTSAGFTKRTPRTVNDYVEHVEGDGIGSVTMHFVDPAALTGHRYALTIDDADPYAKTYRVVDLDLGETVLESVPMSDGVAESPLFDGMRLVVEDLEEGAPDLERTGWVEGDSDLKVTVSGGNALLALQVIPMLATEDIYELTMADAVVDTSEALYALSAQEMRFTVTAESDGLPRPVLFRDSNRDGVPGGGSELYILEEYPAGTLVPAWHFRFSALGTSEPPEAGDVFRLVPLRGLSAADRFEFVAALGVGTDGRPGPEAALRVFGYPNPFGDRLTVGYRVDVPAAARLEVYDLLGRRIAVLADGDVGAGEHRVAWDGRDARGAPVPSGVHLLRLTVQDAGGARRVETAVVRVR